MALSIAGVGLVTVSLLKSIIITLALFWFKI
jgi:hypothetical protein